MQQGSILSYKTIQAPEDPTITLKLILRGGLWYFTGNHAPIFYVTVDQTRKDQPRQRTWQATFGGAELIKHFPDYADLVALDGSDIDGVPTCAVENGWYYLAGALPEHARKEVHYANQKGRFPLPSERLDPARPWQTTDYREPTEAECLTTLAGHLRINKFWARSLAHAVAATALGPDGYDWSAGKAYFTRMIDAMRPRRKAEAEACIERHGLAIFGDPWAISLAEAPASATS